MAINPVKSLNESITLNCQDARNRTHFQVKTAVDWQQNYDLNKKYFPIPQLMYYFGQ